MLIGRFATTSHWQAKDEWEFCAQRVILFCLFVICAASRGEGSWLPFQQRDSSETGCWQDGSFLPRPLKTWYSCTAVYWLGKHGVNQRRQGEMVAQKWEVAEKHSEQIAAKKDCIGVRFIIGLSF